MPHVHDDSLCCRVFRVEGVVTPGVHKLTVRVVGCGGACSITSEPSDPIAFHYYNEDAYLLRPDTGCVTCATVDALAVSAPIPSLNQNISALPAESLPKQKLTALKLNHTRRKKRDWQRSRFRHRQVPFTLHRLPISRCESSASGASRLIEMGSSFTKTWLSILITKEITKSIFAPSAPKMPASVRLQFQIQPHSNSPWYTVTLAPIEFPYPAANDENSQCAEPNCGKCDSGCNKDSKDCCGKARECVCKGHSEILRRCYNEMSQDAKIRRSGSARIGFGVDVP